ncbi:hypothetical protein MXB_155 [Myxobolus squamalis]|nr:hypothetical protein MXB_155 [Myxobolus squamalis]
MDSIFKSCPITFYQLYILHVYEQNLLGILKKLMQEDKNFHPAMVMIDFEYAACCSLTSIRPNICFKE